MNNTGGIKFSLDRTGCSSLSLIQFHSEETNFLCFPCRRSIQLGFYLTGALIHLLGLDPSSCPASTASSPAESPSPPAHSSLKLPVVCGSQQAGKGREREPPRELHLFKQSQVCVVSPRGRVHVLPSSADIYASLKRQRRLAALKPWQDWVPSRRSLTRACRSDADSTGSCSEGQHFGQPLGMQ